MKVYNKYVKISQYLSIILKRNSMNVCRISLSKETGYRCFSNASFNHYNHKNILSSIPYKNFSTQVPKEVTHQIYMPIKKAMLVLIEDIKIQEKSLENLKNEFEQKTKFLEQDSTNLAKYSCSKKCLTINPLFSDSFDTSKAELDIFITESRNRLRSNLNSIISEAKGSNISVKIQVNGNAGTGKTFSLADFVILARMLNLESKDKVIIYYNFFEKTNRDSLFWIKDEIFSAIYPLIKDELEKVLFDKNYHPIKVKIDENSLFHLVLKMFDSDENKEQMDLITQILEKLEVSYPDYQTLVILDQINEIGKGMDPEPSELFFKNFKNYGMNNLVAIYCASNNNEFNRQNMWDGLFHKMINHDLKLNDFEAASIIQEYGFSNTEHIQAIIRFTKNVPLFLNFLRKTHGNEIERIERLKDKVTEFLKSRAENFINNYYSNFDKGKQALFKQIVYYLESDVGFEYERIKDIFDYQLFELEFPTHSQTNESTDNDDSESIELSRDQNKAVRDLYSYLDKNKEKIETSLTSDDIFDKIDLFYGIYDLKVKVRTRYPKIIEIYEDILKGRKDNLVTPGTLALAIRHYLNYNFEREKTRSLDVFENRSRQKWGFYFEDIINQFISENKKEKFIPYVDELKFLENWERQRYYDAIEEKEYVTFDSEKITEFEKLGTRNVSMLYPKYPVPGKILVPDTDHGLFFTNLTSNHKTIDGGFLYLTNLISESREETILNIITYDFTIGDKTNNFSKVKIAKLEDNLSKIYKNVRNKKDTSLRVSKENFIKHYFIILENKEFYRKEDAIDPANYNKANELHKFLNQNIEDNRDKFGIIVARLIKEVHEGLQVETIQLLPFPTPQD